MSLIVQVCPYILVMIKPHENAFDELDITQSILKFRLAGKPKSLWLIEHYLPDDILFFLGHQGRLEIIRWQKKKKYKVNGQMFQISFSHNVKLRGAIFFWTHLK